MEPGHADSNLIRALSYHSVISLMFSLPVTLDSPSKRLSSSRVRDLEPPAAEGPVAEAMLIALDSDPSQPRGLDLYCDDWKWTGELCRS